MRVRIEAEVEAEDRGKVYSVRLNQGFSRPPIDGYHGAYVDKKFCTPIEGPITHGALVCVQWVKDAPWDHRPAYYAGMNHGRYLVSTSPEWAKHGQGKECVDIRLVTPEDLGGE